MKWSKRVRQFHRWLSIVFMATVVAAIVALPLGEAAEWVFYVPLPPLVLQLFTGLYLFALPYVVKRRTGRGMATREA